MELHQVRYFLAVARRRNFSRAAEQCHVSQPSLSQQIMKLEQELEERLFERTKREVSLTPAGERFRAHAERVVEAVEEAKDCVRDVRGVVCGRVELGALPTVAPYYLPQRLREFARRHPAVDVVVHEDTTGQLAQAVRAREIDVALVSLPVEGPGLVSTEFFHEDLLAALPVRHPLARRTARPLALGDLEHEAFILMKEGHCLAGQTLQFCHLKGFSPRVSFRSAQIETVLAFVAAGWGVSIIPAMAQTHRRPGVVYRPITGVRRGIGVIQRGKRPLSRAAQALVAFLQETGGPGGN